MEMLFVFLLIQLTYGNVEASGSDCPSGWKNYDTSCYLLVAHTLTKPAQSWEDARINCLGYGGDLVSINSDGESKFIKTLTGNMGRNALWIGLYRNKTIGAATQGWIWVDGSKQNYVRWQKGEPNNWNGWERCGEVYAHMDRWNDDNCRNRLASICERKKGLPPPSATPVSQPKIYNSTIVCEPGWKAFRQSCYKFERRYATWQTAKSRCGALGCHLLKINDAVEQGYLAFQVKDSLRNYWIGLNDLEKNTTWVWESDKSQANFTNWLYGEPNGQDREQCVEMFGGYQSGFWNDGLCRSRKYYICEKEEGKDWCPSSWVSFEDDCYQFNVAVSQLKSWDYAKSACESVGDFSSLAIIKSKKQQDFITKRISSSGRDEFWIGLNDIETEKVFKWSDKTPLNSADYTNWLGGKVQPGNAAWQDCVLLSGQLEGSWYIDRCTHQRRFICQRKKAIFNCNAPLGMENGNIGDDQITASSFLKTSTRPENARLNSDGSWCPSSDNSDNEYLEVDLGSVYRIRYIAVQGLATSYCVKYGTDGKGFRYYGNRGDSCQDLHAEASEKVHYLRYLQPFIARYVRISPRGKQVCLRVEFFGCLSAKTFDHGVIRSNWEKLSGIDGMSYQVNYKTLSWPDARSYCLEQNADLLSINNNGMQRSFANQLRRLPSYSYWIGLNDRDYTSNYYWSDGSPMNLFSWGRGYPTDRLDIYSCVQIRRSDASWLDANCNEKRPFICMKKEIVRSSAIIGTGLTGVWMSSASYYWPLSTVHDGKTCGTTTGNVYGTVNSISGVKNMSNAALQFVGSGSYIDAGSFEGKCLTYPDICSLRGLTISFMASFDSVAANWQERVNILDSLGTSEQNSTGVAVYVKNKKLVFVVSTVSSYWKSPGVDILGDGVWHHYAFSWNRLHMSVYLDGSRIWSRAYMPSFIKRKLSKSLKKDFHIGIQPNSNIKTGKVNLALLAVWETILHTTQTTGIYKTEFGWCPSRWISFGMSCYQFNTKPQTWSRAREQCQLSGSDLVAISSPVEQAFITQHLDSSSWIGLNEAQHSIFTWSTADRVVYTNWRSSIQLSYRRLKACARARAYGFGSWYQASCFSPAAFVCEKGKVENKPAYNLSDVYTPKFERVCQFSKAKLYCPSGTAIRIDHAFWGRRRRDLCRHISIINCGLKTINSTTQKVRNLCNDKSSCDLYASSHANYFENPCIGVYKYLEVNYTCVHKDSKYNGSCPIGWKLSHDGNMCHGLILKKKTWHDAENECKKFNGNLLSINGRFEQAMATSLMERAWNTDVWIGLNDLKAQGVYEWSDSNPVSWTNWYVGHPDERQTGKSCVYMNLTRSKKDWMFWRNGNCSRESVFMCSKKLGLRSTSAPKEGKTCPASWASYGTNCYKLFESEMNWLTSRRNCQRSSYGRGNLVSIMSLEENDFIRNLANRTIWIGLESRGVFRGHTWSDKKPVAYTNWDVGQPDSYNGREDCTQLYINTGYWIDIDCSHERSSVCKVPKASTVIPSSRPSLAPTFGPPSSLCKRGWMLFNNMCYYIGNTTINYLKTWHEAEVSCRKMGSHLVSVHSEAEKNFLVQVTRYMHTYSFWLGLNDIGSESNYKWSDGSGYGNFIFWSNGEPNDYHGQEDCVAMSRISGKWNDNHCSSKKAVICKAYNETSIKLATLVPGRKVSADGYCAPGWFVNGDWCYEFHTDPTDYKTWYNAKQTCEKGYNSSDVGELVSISNQIEQAFITLKLKGTYTPLWIGLNNFHNYRSFAWTDNSAANFYYWNVGQPFHLIWRRRFCVEISPYTSDAGRWNSASCYKLNGYICKTAAKKSPYATMTTALSSISCPDGYNATYQQSCYKFVKSPKTFDNARKTCSLDAANLISIRSHFEQAYLLYLLKRNFGSVWIGLSHEPWSSFVFTDHSPPSYSYWGVGKPNRKPDQRSCVQINMTGQDLGLWDDADCNNKNPFVCQIYKGEPETTLSEHSLCKEGWEKYHQFCYKYFGVPKPWPEARVECQNEGGDLLSVSDDREQDFAMYTFYNKGRFSVWLGLNDRNEKHGYQWSDGSAVSYINWEKGQPNDNRQTHNCVLMNSFTGKWSDWFCASRFRFICKRTLECSSQLPFKPSMISVSESSTPNLGPDQAIINDDGHNNYTWCANISSRKPRIQIDLQGLVKVTTITIQGRSEPSPQYVRSFFVQYSSDGFSWTTYSLDGVKKIFFANNDGKTQITKKLDPPIKASSIAIIPLTWDGKQICMKVALGGCEYVCSSSLGMKSWRIADNYIVAKSAKYPTNEPRQVRPLGKGWCAATNDDQQWIQVDLITIHLVTKIRTFGDRENSFVKSYKIQFSGDENDWVDYKQYGVVRIFKGNVHATHPVTRTLSNSIQASFIRIVPLSWKNNICMRFELFGCLAKCDGPLIQIGNEISDVVLSSSDPNSHPEYARLNSGKAWCTNAEKGQYLEVDFAKRVRLRKITTLGSPLGYGQPRRVVTFTISFKKNRRWKQYTVEQSVKHIVSGNSNDSTSPSTYYFGKNDNGVLATRARLYPQVFTKSGICMRVEFYGCLAEDEIIPTLPPASQKLLYVSLRFLSLQWSSELESPSSEKFQNISKIISNSITNVYENNDDIREGEALREVTVTRMRKGSVIADMILVFNPQFAQNENISKPLMDAVSSGKIGNLKVDKTSLVITENNLPLASKRESEKLSSGAIAGIVVGILLALALVVVVVGVYCVRRRKKDPYAPKQFDNPILYSTANTEEFEDE